MTRADLALLLMAACSVLATIRESRLGRLPFVGFVMGVVTIALAALFSTR